MPSRLIPSSEAWPLTAAQAHSRNTHKRVCYEENGEGGFTSDLSTSVSDFFASFFAFLISFFACFFALLTSFFLCFDFFRFAAIASSRTARQTTSILTPALSCRPQISPAPISNRLEAIECPC